MKIGDTIVRTRKRAATEVVHEGVIIAETENSWVVRVGRAEFLATKSEVGTGEGEWGAPDEDPDRQWLRLNKQRILKALRRENDAAKFRAVDDILSD